MRLLVLTLLCLCTGCGAGDFAFVTPVSPSKAAAAYAFYHAYGDSITAGAGTPRPATDSYPARVATAGSLTLTNHAAGGDQACDLSINQIFPAEESTGLNERGLYSILVGTNDTDAHRSGVYEATFKLCQQAAIAWLAVPRQARLDASDSLVSSTGSARLDTSNHWNALVTDSIGSTATFPLTLPAAAPVYVWYRILDGSPGTFDVMLDGSRAASATTAPIPSVATQNGRNNSLGLLRLPPVAAGAHTLTFVQTGGSAYGMGIVAVGAPPAGAALVTLPRVMVGTVPYQRVQASGYSGVCATDDSICTAYNADVQADVALFQGDGLNVRLFDTRRYMTGTTTDLADSLHPNAAGAAEIEQAFLDAL